MHSSYEDLYVYSAFLDDVENTRIRNANRLQAITSNPQDYFGQGLPILPDLTEITELNDELQRFEQDLIKRIQKLMRIHPLNDWMARTPGIGAKQLARLLGVIGNPADREMVSQLWSYCGLAVVKMLDPSTDAIYGVAPRQKRGQQGGYNPEARKRVWLIAMSCIKQQTSPYRFVYDEGRVKYKDAKHDLACIRCGPSGKPAQPGSDLSDGHKHARAIRLVMKMILKDLWVEAKKTA
jgi:hypothetical protein